MSIIFLLQIFTRHVFIFFVTKKNFRIVKTLKVCVLIGEVNMIFRDLMQRKPVHMFVVILMVKPIANCRNAQKTGILLKKILYEKTSPNFDLLT